MNKLMTVLVALVALAMVGAASATEVVDAVEVRGSVQELVSGVPYPGYSWNAINFAGFWCDLEKDLSSEALTIQPLAAGVNTIPVNGLIYTATMQGAEYRNPSLYIPGYDYRVMGWFGRKCVAVNNQPDVLAEIVLETDSGDKKTLVTGEPWVLGNGYTLIPKQIDPEGNKVWLSLAKGDREVESSIIDIGVIPSGDTFVDMNGCDMMTTDTFVYQPDIGSEIDVPIFTVAVDAVFGDTNSNFVQLKYAMLIDDALEEIGSDYESHKMIVTSITANSIQMQNDKTITLSEDSDVEIMGDIVFRVAEDDDGDAVNEYRFYPVVAGRYEIRGTMVEIVPAGLGHTTWNAQSFPGFWYDIEKDLSSEILAIQALGASVNTIPKYYDAPNCGLTYTATMQGAEYRNPSLNTPGYDYRVMGWFGKSYMALHGNPDVLSPIILEMERTDNKTLVTGEPWDLGNGYILIAKGIDLGGNKVWLSLEKDDVEVESSIVDVGQHPSGDTFVDMNGNYMVTADTFVYQPDIGYGSDVPIFTVAVTAVSRDTNLTHLKYAMLIDDELLEIRSDYESHKMIVTSISDTAITMQNIEEISLTPDSDVRIMGDIVFHVAEDDDGDAFAEYRFYPAIRSEEEPQPDTIPATDTDCDGVPDVWDADNNTPAGHWVNPQGIGRMLGDMDGDGRLTSADALMILQAAVGRTDL